MLGLSCGREGENKGNSSYFFSPNSLSGKELSSKIPRCVSPVMGSFCMFVGPPKAALLVSWSFSQQCTGAAPSAAGAAGAVNGLI